MFNWFRRKPPPSPQGPKTEFEAKGLKIGDKFADGSIPGVTWNVGTWRHPKGTTDQVMIKIIDLEQADKEYEMLKAKILRTSRFKMKLDKELDNLRSLKHKNILPVHGIFEESNPDKVLIVFERAKMTLTTYVEKAGPVEENQAKVWMGQIAQALDYLHNRNCAHCRINPDAMLVTGPQRCLLTKFGDVIIVTEKLNTTSVQANDPSYRSPEMADRTKPFDAKAADVWALGCVIFFLLKGKKMFKDPLTEHVDVRQRISTIECEDCQSILMATLEHDPKRRLTMADVVRHNWFVTDHPSSPHNLYRPEPVPVKDYGRSFKQLGHSTGFFIERMSAAGYSIQFKIGEGSYGEVYRGMKRTKDGEVPVALKVIKGLNKKEQKRYRETSYKTEMKVAETFVHPNIIRVFDVFRETNTKGRKHDRRSFVWMELAARDLHACIVESGKLDEKKTQKYMKDTVNGLKFLYDNNIAHRDLKPPNILVMADDTAKVTDFSVVREIGHDALSDTATGNPNYMSPQVASLKRNNPFKGDVWSLGLVIFECLMGRRPYWFPELGNFDHNIKAYDDLSQDIRSNVKNTDILMVLTNMLNVNEQVRWDMEQVYNDPWFFGKAPSRPGARGARIVATGFQESNVVGRTRTEGLVGSSLSSFSDKSKSDSFPGMGRGPGGRGPGGRGPGPMGFHGRGAGRGPGGFTGGFDTSFSQ